MKPILLLVLVAGLALPAPAQNSRIFHYGADSWTVAASPDKVAVGFEAGDPAFAAEETFAIYRGLFAALLLDLPPHHVAVYRLAPGVAPELAITRLVGDPRHAFATQVLHLGDPANPDSMYLLTRDLCLGVVSGADAQAVAATIDADVIRGFAWPGTHLLRLRRSSGLDALQAAEKLLADGRVLFAHPDWLRRIAPREFLPNDPQFAGQWHLKNTGQGGGLPGADVKATFAWDITTGNAGVIVAVIDSGVESTHADIAQTPNGYNALCGAGPLMGDPVPTGCSSSFAGSHGTSCAGVAAARINNSLGVAGIAGSCTVMPINLLGSGLGYGTPSMEAACFDWATQNGASVITNSWGPDGVPWPLPALVQTAFVNATTNGRGGLGCCIYWAAGNGNELITTDGYASSIYTFAVGASTNSDVRSSYSDFGPELDAVAPSSGGSLGITTTSTTSAGGTTYTTGFGGTSSASPLGAGIGALVLTANPGLTWTQVRDILRSTAVKIDPSPSPAAPNYYNPATGHSTWYGYGRLDAYQAVVAAQSAGTGFNYTVTTTGIGDLNLQVVHAPASAELFIPVSLTTSIPLGTGPVFGLAADAFFTIFYPLGTHPFHVLADAAGAYSLVLPGGSLPPGLGTDSRCIAFNPGFVFAAASAIRRVIF